MPVRSLHAQLDVDMFIYLLFRNLIIILLYLETALPIQRVADERTAKATELEHKVAQLEVDITHLIYYF